VRGSPILPVMEALVCVSETIGNSLKDATVKPLPAERDQGRKGEATLRAPHRRGSVVTPAWYVGWPDASCSLEAHAHAKG